jgi:hypothetical protein
VDVNATSSVVAKNFTVSAGTSAADLLSAVDDAIAASAAAALPGVGVGDVSGGTLAAGVYNATSVDLNKTTFTVTGDPSQTFVLNVSGGFDVHQSEIVLEGGINASNVLFNVVGTGDVVTVGHSATVFQRDLLAVDRSIVVSELGVDSAPGAGPAIPGSSVGSSEASARTSSCTRERRSRARSRVGSAHLSTGRVVTTASAARAPAARKASAGEAVIPSLQRQRVPSRASASSFATAT